MKTGILLMVLTGLLKAEAGGGAVQVYVEDCMAHQEQVAAQYVADRMFSEAGVRISWKFGAPRGADNAAVRRIVVHFSTQSDPGDHPGALAYARPYGENKIEILYDRVRNGTAGFTGVVLAHVLVHEITHVLQGIARHSAEGVMKAHWSAEDYNAMKRHPLPLSAHDIDLIHDGLYSVR